jgi:hemolysin activation/secretion protein
MAIDLPPVIPPQASSAERIEQYAAAQSDAIIDLKIGEYDLRISGNRYLSREQIDLIMTVVKTPAQAINALTQAYYQLGHLLVTVYFAHRDNTIFAHVINGHLAEIEAPEGISPYFSSLIGDQDLTRSEFETKRVLADLKSERTGLDYGVSYQLSEDPTAFTIVLTESKKEDHDSTDLSFSANNYGNRFLGRYFANATLKHDFKGGIQASVSYDRALIKLGEVNGGDYYNGYSFRLNYPSSFGLYGIEARYTEDRRRTDGLMTSEGPTPRDGFLCTIPLVCELTGGLDLSASSAPTTETARRRLVSKVRSVALTAEQVISSDAVHRFTVSQRLENVDSVIDIDGFGNALDEPQTSLELGLKYNKLIHLFGLDSQLTTQGFIEAGLESDAGTLGTDTREGEVATGRRTGEFLVFRPRLALKTAVSDWATLKTDVIGQFSNDQQLPLQQQFFLGGAAGLSAYLPGVLVGDSGSYAKLALESNGFPLFGLTFKPAVFVEHGQAWYEDASGQAGDTRAIADAGLSLKTELGKYFVSEILAATPIYDNNLNEEALSQVEVDFFWRLSITF